MNIRLPKALDCGGLPPLSGKSGRKRPQSKAYGNWIRELLAEIERE